MNDINEIIQSEREFSLGRKIAVILTLSVVTFMLVIPASTNNTSIEAPAKNTNNKTYENVIVNSHIGKL